jgi:hypothetical protein
MPALTYGIISELIRDYREDAPIWAERPLTDAPQVRTKWTKEHVRSSPQSGVPRIPTEDGPHLIFGIHFGEDGPLLVLLPESHNGPEPGARGD